MTLSPKVVLPASLLTLVGIGLLVAGLILKDGDLRAAGLGLLVGGPAAGAVGYQAPHPVPVQTAESSDELNAAKFKRHLK